MSNPNLPNITPQISLTRDQAINLLLASIAMEELGLAHIINAEGEKIQYALGTLHSNSCPRFSLREILAVNSSAQEMLETVFKEEMLLESKLKNVMKLLPASERDYWGHIPSGSPCSDPACPCRHDSGSPCPDSACPCRRASGCPCPDPACPCRRGSGSPCPNPACPCGRHSGSPKPNPARPYKRAIRPYPYECEEE